jgi:crotonobetainyl-CoA:carnitine CoA-transferase CaiB-like acyl-CoA transferase
MSDRPMNGVRVIEVAAWTFVPAAGAVLADWGADVIKIEHPAHGDPQRGLAAGGMLPSSSVNFIIEIPNRGKRSVGLDLASDAGRALLYNLVAGADVFVTSFLPEARRRLRIDLEQIRAVNPKIIYVRGSANGVRGPDAEAGGYDATSYWARSGVASLISQGDEHPRTQPIAFGDIAAAQTIAGGIAAALYARETTGEPSVVDVSLLSYGLWNASPHIVLSKVLGIAELPQRSRGDAPNPIVGAYKTADDRMVQLVMLQSDRYWARLCALLGRPDLADDPRFADASARAENSAACVAELDTEFGRRTLDACVEILRAQDGPWAIHQRPLEIFDDAQVRANEYVQTVKGPDGSDFELVANPVQFDERPPSLVRAPEMGEHTEEVLLEASLSWEDIAELKAQEVIS